MELTGTHHTRPPTHTQVSHPDNDKNPIRLPPTTSTTNYHRPISAQPYCPTLSPSCSRIVSSFVLPLLLPPFVASPPRSPSLTQPPHCCSCSWPLTLMHDTHMHHHPNATITLQPYNTHHHPAYHQHRHQQPAPLLPRRMDDSTTPPHSNRRPPAPPVRPSSYHPNTPPVIVVPSVPSCSNRSVNMLVNLNAVLQCVNSYHPVHHLRKRPC